METELKELLGLQFNQINSELLRLRAELQLLTVSVNDQNQWRASVMGAIKFATVVISSVIGILGLYLTYTLRIHG